MFEIVLYESENNKVPVHDFVYSLPKKLISKVLRDIDILAEHGHTLREPYSKHITDGLFELRTKFGSDITRIFYFFFIDNKIVLTNGFVKKIKRLHLKK